MPDEESIDLSAWYAEPVSMADAELRLGQIRAQRKQINRLSPMMRIEEMVMRFSLGRDVKGDMETLIATIDDEALQALVYLIYGQLLMSRKLHAAMEYLQQGFALAVPHFSASEYLKVMRRHQMLNHIVLGPVSCNALTLDELLIEAEIVSKLKGSTDYRRDIRVQPNKDPAKS